MIKHTMIGLMAAVLLVASPAVPASEDTSATSEFGFLVTGEGAEETYGYCAACHSERLVAQQGLTRARWSGLLEWMVEEQGMAEIEEPDLGRILDYLANNYGTDRPNFPKP
ncbi:MAG: aldehyde dehydrogenase [Alphaproteobacteria bacterium]